MIRHIFKLDRYNWKIIAFYDVTEDDEDEILQALEYIGCQAPQLRQARMNIEDGMMDNGFTFSNYNYNVSVVVIGYGSDDSEAMNTLAHEARHVEQHISKAFNIDEIEEERYYLIGKLVKTMYSKFKTILRH